MSGFARCPSLFTKTDVCNHTFRGTGITAYFENGGTLERARQMAAHASTRTAHPACESHSSADRKLVPVTSARSGFQPEFHAQDDKAGRRRFLRGTGAALVLVGHGVQ